MAAESRWHDTRTVRSIRAPANHKGEHAISGAAGKAERVAAKTVDKMKNAGDKVADKVKSASQTAGKKLEDAGDKLKHIAS